MEDLGSVVFYIGWSLAATHSKKDLLILPRIGECICFDDGVYEVFGIQHEFRIDYPKDISIFLRKPETDHS